MDQQDKNADREAGKKLVGHIVEEMRRGSSDDEVTDQLTEMGVDRAQARTIVHEVRKRVQEAAEQEVLTPGSVAKAFIGAGIAVIVGGVVWGLIVLATGYEIGFMAVGIGILAGLSVNLISGKRGRPLQVIAVLAAVGGIVIGKYFTFFSILKDVLGQEVGLEAAASVSMFSPSVIATFFSSLPSVASPYDILWVVLAVLAAWRLPKGLGLGPAAGRPGRP
ncbi:MAG: hypothetical protein R3191_00175 [Anaerolineales bacterium]|nr:hypothetical protein [Anaerolineales bacterium]